MIQAVPGVASGGANSLHLHRLAGCWNPMMALHNSVNSLSWLHGQPT